MACPTGWCGRPERLASLGRAELEQPAAHGDRRGRHDGLRDERVRSSSRTHARWNSMGRSRICPPPTIDSSFGRGPPRVRPHAAYANTPLELPPGRGVQWGMLEVCAPKYYGVLPGVRDVSFQVPAAMCSGIWVRNGRANRRPSRCWRAAHAEPGRGAFEGGTSRIICSTTSAAWLRPEETIFIPPERPEYLAFVGACAALTADLTRNRRVSQSCSGCRAIASRPSPRSPKACGRRSSSPAALLHNRA